MAALSVIKIENRTHLNYSLRCSLALVIQGAFGKGGKDGRGV